MKQEYFEWMCRLIMPNGNIDLLSYHELLYFLNDVEFSYTLPMDGNRYEDGIDLRYRFGYEELHTPMEISSCLDLRPCSVLEMMVALAVRCEEAIMSDPDYGDRTYRWFWEMIKSLGLSSMVDGNFDADQADQIITKFLNREYDADGKGGLFTVKSPPKDMRDVEIWCQMCWYLNEVNQDGIQPEGSV